MEYTPIEKQALGMMRRTDFKNLSKTDVLSIASKSSSVLVAGLVVGVSVLGGNVNIKLPKKS